MPSVDGNGAGPQPISADLWLRLADNNAMRGWHPIPTGRIENDDKYKKPWLKGLTGYVDFATADQFSDWPRKVAHLQSKGAQGILSLGLRCPETIVGIDVDEYGNKHGLESLRELESMYGNLPTAPVVTARELQSGNGIRLFRIPSGWRGKTNPANGIELIQWWHRHIQAPPSWHYTGRTYQCYNGNGASQLLPHIDHCPVLPDDWLAGLADSSQGGVGGASDEEIADFERRYNDGPQPSSLDGLIRAKFAQSPDDTHTPMLILLCKAAQEAKGRRYAWAIARDKIFAAAQDAYAARGKHLKQADFDAAVRRAIKYVADMSEQECYTGWQSDDFKKAEANFENSTWAGKEQSDPTQPTQIGIDNKIRIKREHREAERLLSLNDWVEPDDQGNLTHKLAHVPPKREYVVAELIPINSAVMVNAQAKAGKTRLVSVNLVACCVSGKPFLGRFAVSLGVDDNVGVWNFEIDDDLLTEWLRQFGLTSKETDRVFTHSARGDRSLDFNNPLVVEWTVKWLRKNNIRVWVIDPLSKLYRGKSMDNDEFNAWWLIVEDIARQAELKAVVIVHHTGHAEEAQDRGRGASAMMGNPDVFWTYRHSEPGKAKPKGTQRYLEAFGRGVDVDEFQVDFDPATGYLTMTGQGGRVDIKRKELAIAATMAVIRLKSSNQGDLYKELKWTRGSKSSAYMEAITYAHEQGWIDVKTEGKSTIHSKGLKAGEISDDGVTRKIPKDGT